LSAPLVPRVAEELPDDAAAKRYACVIADEINRHAKQYSPVLVLDNEGRLLAAVRPIEE
jgi:hypothetical protein